MYLSWINNVYVDKHDKCHFQCTYVSRMYVAKRDRYYFQCIDVTCVIYVICCHHYNYVRSL